ncbi:MAG: CcmD family protein [Saprospiraceae bacterium]|jgi:hypothetical protein
MKSKQILFYLLILVFTPFIVNAENLDFMRNSGKINVVFGVILVVFIGIVLFLIFLQRKIINLENKINNE